MTPKKKDADWRARVRAELGTRGWPDTELGRRMGLKHPMHVSRWITAKSPAEPKWSVIVQMADALGVGLEWFAGKVPGPDESWTEEDLARAFRSLSPAHSKVLKVLFSPGGAAHLEAAADQYLALRRSLGR